MINIKELRQEIKGFVMPIIYENILQLSAGIISTAMIGRLLASDISAQGACIRITDTIWSLFKGLSVGLLILLASAYKQKNKQKCLSLIKQSLQMGFILAFTALVVLFGFSKQILSFFSTDPDIINKAHIYLRIIVFNIPFVMISSVVSASFQAFGDTKTPMKLAAIMNIINIVLGWLLIFGNFIFPAMGIQGAAVSLLIAQASSAIIGIILLNKKISKDKEFAVNSPLNYKWEWGFKYIKQIYGIGVPAALENMFWQFSAILLSKMILTHGINQFAAYQIGLQAELITEMPAIAFGTAATALIAKGLSESNELGKAYFTTIKSIAIKYSIVTSLLLILLSTLFMKAMTSNPLLIPIGATYVMIMGFIQIPQNLSRIYNGALRSSGIKTAPMIIAGIGIWCIRIPICALVTYVFKLDIVYIWLTIALDQAIRFCISVITLNKKKVFAYKTNKVQVLES